MRWLVFGPLILFAVAASANLAVALLLERAERQRRRRHRARPRRRFRPVVIQGGKPPAPPAVEPAAGDSKIA